MDITDADLAGEQEAEDPQPGRIRESLEQRLHVVKLLGHISALTNRARACRLRYIRVSTYMESPMTDVQDAVKSKYGAIANAIRTSSIPAKVGCCGPTSCGCGGPITSKLYSDSETAEVPADAVAASLGCGN